MIQNLSETKWFSTKLRRKRERRLIHINATTAWLIWDRNHNHVYSITGVKKNILGSLKNWPKSLSLSDGPLVHRTVPKSHLNRITAPAYSTGLCPLSGPLPCFPHENQGESRAGQGNRWPFDAFRLLIMHSFNSCIVDASMFGPKLFHVRTPEKNLCSFLKTKISSYTS